MDLSTDALGFGLAYLRGPKSKLSFGGIGAVMEITPRARAALSELLEKGYAIAVESDRDGGEAYVGAAQEPPIGEIARERGLDPFGEWQQFAAFVRRNEGRARVIVNIFPPPADKDDGQ